MHLLSESAREHRGRIQFSCVALQLLLKFVESDVAHLSLNVRAARLVVRLRVSIRLLQPLHDIVLSEAITASYVDKLGIFDVVIVN